MQHLRPHTQGHGRDGARQHTMGMPRRANRRRNAVYEEQTGMCKLIN
jgi:hypothetical protein